uniref:diflavin oxidoreductase n=1 Tax=Thaumasiovibrio occultus TaxID=1891184 RepID=UPI000B35C0EF|nr:sulfite reductase flavoprotein subunit alpha [Thaumasiovibrio occultus]
MKIPFIPQDAPFSGEQKQWLGGFLAGLHSRMLVKEEQVTQVQAQVQVKPLTILYGSQTGNSESVAYDAAAAASAHGLAATVYDMDDASVELIASSERLLIVTSTYGEGEMPDNAQQLWDAISADDAPKLDQTWFAVLALGDTSYDAFCLAGQLWDDRLVELGAQRLLPRVDCDVDFEDLASDWYSQALPQIAQKGSQQTGAAPAPQAAAKPKSQYGRKNPMTLTLDKKRVVTGEGSSKEIVHYEFSWPDAVEGYEAGDALNLVPQNDPAFVQGILQHLNLSGEERVPYKDDRVALGHLLQNELEIRLPSKELLQALAERAGDHQLEQRLNGDNSDALNDWLWGKDTLDILQDYAGIEFGIVEFINLLKPIAPRAYSISSAQQAVGQSVHLTIGSVRYGDDRERQGVCSVWLADRLEEGQTLPGYFAPNKSFSIPKEDSAPMIMVGPGTGIAPFLGFLQARKAKAASGDNWLFFGDRNAASDFIYQQELEAWVEEGLLSRLDTAFSRDQKEKIYVQDLMRAQGEQLFAWLERGGYFFICGDAYRMAKDVDVALHDIVATWGKMDQEQAQQYVNQLKKDKRYVRDVY